MDNLTRIFEVRTFTEYLYCNGCGVVMEDTGDVLYTSPPTYKYECPRCRCGINSHQKYPVITYIKNNS